MNSEIVATPKKPLDYRKAGESVLSGEDEDPQIVAAPSDLNFAGGPTL